WRYRTVELDPIARIVAHGHPLVASSSKPIGPGASGVSFQPSAYWMIAARHHHLASLYPIVAPVLVAPLYLPAMAWLRLQGWQRWQIDWMAAVMEKVTASLLAALAVV